MYKKILLLIILALFPHNAISSECPTITQGVYACQIFNYIDPFYSPMTCKEVIRRWIQCEEDPNEGDLFQMNLSPWLSWSVTQANQTCQPLNFLWGETFVVVHEHSTDSLWISIEAYALAPSIPMVNIFLLQSDWTPYIIDLPWEYAARPLEAGETWEFKFPIPQGIEIIRSEVAVLSATSYESGYISGWGYDVREDWDIAVPVKDTTWGNIKSMWQ